MNTNPEPLPTMAQAVVMFLGYQAGEKNASPATVKTYMDGLGQALANFREQLNEDDPAIDKLSPRLLRGYLAWLGQHGYAKATVQARISAVRSLCRWAARRKLLAVNPADGLRAPRQGGRKLPRVLSIEEVEKLLAAPSPHKTGGLRDRAVLEVLYSGGLRAAELVGLNVDDVDLAEGLATIRGKGRRERLAPHGPPATAALRKWLEARPEYIDGIEPPPAALFVGREGLRLSTRSLGRLVSKHVARAGLDPRTSPHTLRHSFASHLAENGADIRTIQELLGHRSVSTSMIYVHTTARRNRDEYDKAHPRA